MPFLADFQLFYYDEPQDEWKAAEHDIEWDDENRVNLDKGNKYHVVFPLEDIEDLQEGKYRVEQLVTDESEEKELTIKEEFIVDEVT
ncbi:immunoglobulin-like domain-containing protein [Natranaerobius thermophilus]|uniref:immunoglobulin-like domain-containing protein n=1 Tax=Natranaerobius thermophilus TaxID=375929 RepID=UPI002F415D28